MKRSKYYKSCPKIFADNLKKALIKRVDSFAAEAPSDARTDEEWMRDFLKWSERKAVEK